MSTTDQQARDSLRHLVAHVLAHRDGLIDSITYKELAGRIGRLNRHGDPYARGMGKVLSKVRSLLDSVVGELGEPIPYIESLVVLKTGPMKGIPSYGVDGFWPGFSEMTKAEKLNHLRGEYQQILAFGSRWEQVLDTLELPKVALPSSVRSTEPYGDGQESIAHKALKDHVRLRPEIVGADEESLVFVEYSLPSLDQVDIVFKSSTEIVAVEVKSRISDHYPSDYERGIYQTVKYGALLAAMTQDDRYRYDNSAKARAVLVLETQLPQEYEEVADALDIEIVDGIVVAEG